MSDTLAQALDAAAQLFRAEQWAAAEQAYRAILTDAPEQIEALHRLSGVLLRTGRIAEGLATVERAIALQPRPEFLVSRAELLQRAGRGAEALAAGREATLRAPGWAIAHLYLGQLLLGQGVAAEAAQSFHQAIQRDPALYGAYVGLAQAQERQQHWAAAADAYQEAIRLRPSVVAPRLALGGVLAAQGLTDAAVATLQLALEMAPNDADAHNNLGVLVHRQGQAERALEHFRSAVAVRPESATIRTNYGNALFETGDNHGALAELDRAVALDPGYPEAHYNRGNVLRRLDRLDEALAAFSEALRLNPSHVEALTNLGTVQFEQRRLDAALACEEAALRLRPGSVEAMLNRAVIRLLTGDYAAGWRDYEARLQLPASIATQRELGAPQWRGEDIGGRTILLYGEQGLGDCLQFMRYAPLLVERGVAVLLDVPAPLVPLARAQSGFGQVLEPGTATPAFDVHCPLMSLPLAFGTSVDSIPDRVPYLTAPADRIADWGARFAALPPGLRIGLVWAGSPHRGEPDGERMNRRRSVTLAALAPVLAIPGAVFVSLQTGEAAAEAAAQPGLVEAGTALTDFAETAAAMSHLDLILGVDTAAMHLAGALGKPAWLLSRFDGDWRWLLDRSDSPWYPTMRIYRQARPGEWGPVIAAVARDLEAWVAATRPTA